MKKISIALLLSSVCAHSVNAQEYSIGEVDTKWFSGVQQGRHEMSYTAAYFFEHPPKDSALLGLVNIGPGMNAEYSSKTAIKKGLELAAYSVAEQEGLIVLNDRAKKSRILMLLNRDGKVVKTKTEDKLSEYEMMPENAPRIFSSMQPGYVLLVPVKEKATGYELRGLDPELNERWKKKFVHEKMNWEVVDVKKNMDHVLLVRKQTTNTNISYSIQSIQLNDGNIEPETELRDGEDIGEYCNISESEGLPFLTGLYYNRRDDGTSLGMKGVFFTMLEPNGHFPMFNRISFDKMKESSKNAIVNKIAAGTTKVYPQAAYRDRRTNEMVLVAETYRQATAEELKTATAKGTGIISDGVLTIRMDMEGNFKNLSYTNRPDRIALVSNVPENVGIDGIANWLNKQFFFLYAGIFSRGEDMFIGYKNREKTSNKLAFIKTDTAKVVLPKPLEYNMMPVEQDSNAIAYYDMAVPATMQKNTADMNNNILPGLNRDFIMLYQLKDSRLLFTKKQIEAKL